MFKFFNRKKKEAAVETRTMVTHVPKRKEPLFDITNLVDTIRRSQIKPVYEDGNWHFSIGELFFEVTTESDGYKIHKVRAFTMTEDAFGTASNTISEFISGDVDLVLLDNLRAIIQQSYRISQHEVKVNGFAKLNSLIKANANAN